MKKPEKTPVIYSYEYLTKMDLEESLRIRLAIEYLHLFNLIPDDVYYTKYPDNAELFDRDYEIFMQE
jgi:geranylgeranyl pyrophosphate synthase